VLLDLRDLSLRGGERHERTYSLGVAPVVLGGVDYEVLVSQGVTLTVTRVTGGFLIDVSLDARVYGPCARCLREVALQVRAKQQEFAPTAKDGWEESDLSAFVEDMVVDVVRPMRRRSQPGYVRLCLDRGGRTLEQAQGSYT
jgi:uncharacterized metal-binding protein YceD (DUF177 family)